MKFGLWFEPEMISEDSDLYRAHPDWAFAIPGRVPNHSRNQLVLDMTREDVREYLLERLTTIVHDAKIDYVKWGYEPQRLRYVYSHVASQNRNGELYHRYVLGVYDLPGSVSLPHARICCLRAAAEAADDMMPV